MKKEYNEYQQTYREAEEELNKKWKEGETRNTLIQQETAEAVAALELVYTNREKMEQAMYEREEAELAQKVSLVKPYYDEYMNAVISWENWCKSETEKIVDNCDFLPVDYYDRAGDIVSIFERGRADTMKEALNVLADDDHRKRLERMEQEKLRVAEEAREEAKRDAERRAKREEEEAERRRKEHEESMREQRIMQREMERQFEETQRQAQEAQYRAQEVQRRANQEAKFRAEKVAAAQARYNQAAAFYESYSKQGLTADAIRVKADMDKAMAEIIANK